MKGDKLGRQGGSSSQEHPRMEIMKGDTLARQGGSGITTIWRFRESATQSLRSKNPYSFQLSGEKRKGYISAVYSKPEALFPIFLSRACMTLRVLQGGLGARR